MNALYHAHSVLRYLVLLAAIAAMVALVYGVATGRALRLARILPAAFTGLLDLQILLGIALVLGGLLPDAAVGHLVMMVFAAVAAHGSSVLAQRSMDERRALAIRLGGVALAVVLIAAGVLALGRGILGSAPPSVG